MQQLNLFNIEIEEVDTSIKIQTEYISKHTDIDIEIQTNDSLVAPNIEEPTLAFEVGDTVKVIFPTEDEDLEFFNYLEYYYPHIRNKKGKILQIMPYKKLQYLIEFDLKHEDNKVILYHQNLEWIGR